MAGETAARGTGESKDQADFTDLLSDFFGGLSGKTQSEAAAEAARQQVAFSQEALGFLRGDLEPFRDILSDQQIQDASTFASDPGAQAGFLRDSPLFANIKEGITQDVFNAQSAGGALGSTGTDEILANQFLSAGNALINQQANRANPLINAAQASAAQSGVGSASLLTGIGNATAAGQIGSANADARGQENAIQALSTIASLFGE